MTVALEYAVRPAVPTSPHGLTIIAKTTGASRERATLTWGAKASLPDVGAATNIACCKENLDETERETETVRITNPQDANQYIDVARAKKLSLDKSNENKCNAISSAEQSDSSSTDFTVTGFESDTFTDESFIKKCKTVWNLKNNTTAA